jgi:hypothetical protein
MGGLLFLGFFFLLLIAGAELLRNMLKKGVNQALDEAEKEQYHIGDIGLFLLSVLLFFIVLKLFNSYVYTPKSNTEFALEMLLMIAALIYVGRRVRLF